MARPTRRGNFPGDTEESPPGTEWYWDGEQWQTSAGELDEWVDDQGQPL